MRKSKMMLRKIFRACAESTEVFGKLEAEHEKELATFLTNYIDTQGLPKGIGILEGPEKGDVTFVPEPDFDSPNFDRDKFEHVWLTIHLRGKPSK